MDEETWKRRERERQGDDVTEARAAAQYAVGTAAAEARRQGSPDEARRLEEDYDRKYHKAAGTRAG